MMSVCRSCGATLSREADYCGECGTAVEVASEHGAGSPETGEQIKQRVAEQRVADQWIGPRGTAALYTIGGVVVLAIGYWLGFVGYTEVGPGPEGYGVYQVTYPIPGVVLVLVGLAAVLFGLVRLAGAEP